MFSMVPSRSDASTEFSAQGGRADRSEQGFEIKWGIMACPVDIERRRAVDAAIDPAGYVLTYVRVPGAVSVPSA